MILALDSIRIAIFFFGNIFRIEKIILVPLVYNKKDILNYLLAYLQLYEKFYY